MKRMKQFIEQAKQMQRQLEQSGKLKLGSIAKFTVNRNPEYPVVKIHTSAKSGFYPAEITPLFRNDNFDVENGNIVEDRTEDELVADYKADFAGFKDGMYYKTEEQLSQMGINDPFSVYKAKMSWVTPSFVLSIADKILQGDESLAGVWNQGAKAIKEAHTDLLNKDRIARDNARHQKELEAAKILKQQTEFDYDLRFHDFVMSQAAIRLEGKEHNEKRPSIGLKATIAGAIFRILPVLKSSPKGWTLNGEIELKVNILATEDSQRDWLTMTYRLYPSGTVKAKRWYRRKELTQGIKNIVHELIKEMSADPVKFISLTSHNHCQMCQKELTDETSMAIGIGPECIKYFAKIVEVINTDKTADESIDEIKEIRRQMQQAHPDKGGDTDLFIKLKAELDKLRKENS